MKVGARYAVRNKQPAGKLPAGALGTIRARWGKRLVSVEFVSTVTLALDIDELRELTEADVAIERKRMKAIIKTGKK